MTKPEISTHDAYTILRTALRQEYDDILPVRGPRSYQEGDNEYLNAVEGELARFTGYEEIRIKGERVYLCWYHGGAVE